MTVLALFRELGLAFSDVLLSIDKPGSHKKLPTVGYTGYLSEELDFSPSRLVRKFFRTSYNGIKAVFLVAGNVEHIKRLVFNIKRVRDQPGSLPDYCIRILSHGQLDSVVQTACILTEMEGYHDFEIIGVVGGAVWSRISQRNRAMSYAPYFGEVIVAGSGAEDLYKWVYARGEQYAQRSFSAENSELKEYRASSTIPSLLLEEDTRSTLLTIKKGVGGYYESFYVSRNVIEPIDSVLTIFAAIKKRGGEFFIELRRVFFHRYVSDWLLVISLFGSPREIRVGRNLVIPLGEFELFKIPPIFEPEKEPNWGVSRLAIEMNSADNFRLTVYGMEGDRDVMSKRFASGVDGRRLISAKVAGGNVFLAIREDDFLHYLDRFRSRDLDNAGIVIVP